MSALSPLYCVKCLSIAVGDWLSKNPDKPFPADPLVAFFPHIEVAAFMLNGASLCFRHAAERYK